MNGEQDLEAAWSLLPPAATERGSVQRLVVRLGGERYEHPEAVKVTVEGGIEGDRWSAGKADPDAAVSLMEWSVATLVARGTGPWAGVGDNLLVDLDLSVANLPTGTRLLAGDVLLEVTAKPHLGCAKFQARFGRGALDWVNDKETRHRRLRGVHTRVIHGGTIRRGDTIRIVERPSG